MVRVPVLVAVVTVAVTAVPAGHASVDKALAAAVIGVTSV